MDSPANRYVFDRSGLAESDSYENGTPHKNWEGLLAAIGISAVGWAVLALLITLLLR
jgi:hypothetical protein